MNGVRIDFRFLRAGSEAIDAEQMVGLGRSPEKRVVLDSPATTRA
jgi:hypothetical protein